jgi:hypothetical protein
VSWKFDTKDGRASRWEDSDNENVQELADEERNASATVAPWQWFTHDSLMFYSWRNASIPAEAASLIDS